MNLGAKFVDFDTVALSSSQIDLAGLVSQLRLGHEPNASSAAVEIGRLFSPLIRKYWRDQHCGEYADFFQDVMVRLLRALPQLREYNAFPGLFRRIVITAAADYWRTQGQHDKNVVDIDIESLERSFDDDLSTPVLIRTYLDWLPPREKEVIEMIFMQDLDVEEIAKMLVVSAGSVRMTKARGLQRLRSLIQKV